jgi:hypothetical protein
MYAVCTIRLEQILQVPFLRPVPPVFLVIGAAAWGIVFAGLVHRGMGWVRGKSG